jgi:hypothetical protein
MVFVEVAWVYLDEMGTSGEGTYKRAILRGM